MENGEIFRPSKPRTLRPIRNRKINRRIYDTDKLRPAKRLFTPEIKKYLKEWLIRRRDNPYPTRDEKKSLAYETGLTYIQVCNWFANWRRKLKNAGREPQRKTWAHLIKSYNSQAKGNVEHFSICSDDSIWDDMEAKDHDTKNYISCDDINNNNYLNDYYNSQKQYDTAMFNSTNKYKNHIMEKYLRDLDNLNDSLTYRDKLNEIQSNDGFQSNETPLLTKWIESANKFQPSTNNYINWPSNENKSKKIIMKNYPNVNIPSFNDKLHLREELDAAEALTKLANA